MSRSHRRLALGALLLPAVLLGARDSSACSVCLAGDPFLDAQGTTVQQRGTLSASFQVRGWEKKSGLLPGEAEPGEQGFERNTSQRLDLFVSWTPFDRVTFTLDLPWAFNAITEYEGDQKSTSRLSGFGDLSLAASGVLWRNRPVLPSTWLEGRVFLKFPSGASSVRVDGARDPHLQPGTGSWDVGFGLAGVHKLEWGSLYTSVFYRVNTEGSLSYEYGDVLLANAALQVPLGHALGLAALDRFTPGFELNFRYAQHDEFEGESYADSGGSVLYLTPSLRVRLPWPWEGRAPSLRLAGQIPATSAWLHGFQQEDPIWSAAITYTF